MKPSYDARAVEAAWQRQWEEAGAFQAAANDNPRKFFATIPYPYVNGLLHLGFAVTFLHADITARFKRMQGHNVLFPQAFHCTGMPIVGAAKRVAAGDPSQLRILSDMRVPEAELPSFADPLHWVRYFPPEAERDLRALGAAVDWGRTFITTAQNPRYDAFVRWQFNRLREGGFVRTGKHPVVWCPKDGIPIGDHDRYEGAGETPVEFTLLKFPLAGKFLVAATLRPETVYGQTNLWVDPEATYVEADVDGEAWVLNRGAAEKLGVQGHRVDVRGTLSGESLVGQAAEAPALHRPLPILPSAFIDQAKGTGIVTSVPSDAPDDYVALVELQGDEATLRRYGLDPAAVRALRPVAIIACEGYGPWPAKDVAERLGIRSQREREALERAKEEVYRAGYYRGVMRDNCGSVAGLPVEEAKDRVKLELRAAGEAAVLYELSGPVVCRCLTPAVVRLVEDQWFLAYGDPAWKAKTREALAKLQLHPEAARAQFEHVVGWLRDWACAHHTGLGTHLPWDDRWVVESLSDSTVYMAYYTIAALLRDVQPERLTDDVFDCVFLGRGTAAALEAASGVPAATLDAMRREFLYWYPFDLRHSGKDLIQNHLAFCLFNHVALFPPEHWPRAFGVNGYMTVGGAAMSKSRGTFVLLREALERWGADATRFTLANAGEGLDDPNFDTDFATAAVQRLAGWHGLATASPPTRTTPHPVDSWFRSALARAVTGATQAMETLQHRTALKHGYFDLQRAWEWYLRRCGGVPRADLHQRFLTVQTKLLAPFVPHLAEEVWRALGGGGFVHETPWPTADPTEIDEEAEAWEAYFQGLLDDVRHVLKVTRKTPSRLWVYTAPAWKRDLYREALRRLEAGTLGGGFVKDAVKAFGAFAPAGDVAPAAKALVELLPRWKAEDPGRLRIPGDERRFLAEALPFLRAEFRCEVQVVDAGEAADPSGRAQRALPWKPALRVE